MSERHTPAPADDGTLAPSTPTGALPAPGVHIAIARIDEILAAATALHQLQPSDRHTAAAMPTWRAREHLAGRALLRTLLANTLGQSHAHRPVVPEPAGRPRLGGQPRLGISISHSGGYAAAAVGEGLDVGIDIQIPRPPSPGMIRRCCSPHTAARLTTLHPQHAAHLFARIWSVQEACVKARGTGLSGAPWKITADPDADNGRWDALRWLRPPWPTNTATKAPTIACAIAFGTPIGSTDHPDTPADAQQRTSRTAGPNQRSRMLPIPAP
ncbi:4'-phosphopantetheinyl transferase family protein [Streptomyces californicus]|uniref:4'-phosphopantetheinyl transferase family protein n=1 Tax=Streptomyces californicus TaxID=67351 RepID=UPI0037F45ABE